MPAADLPAWAATWQPDARWRAAAALRPDEFPVLYAGVEHRAWVVALGDFLAGRRSLPPPMEHQHCRFGEWLAHERLTAHGRRPAFREVEALHHQVHDLAAELVALQARNQAPLALQRLPELQQLRDELLDRLDALKRWPRGEGGPASGHAH
jgi:hypothetical protein